MTDRNEEHTIESKQGATVKIEHKRGTGTRDQDKVQVKIHDSGPVVEKGLENACNEAVQKTMDTMQELRKSVYTGEEFDGSRD